jgi:nucleoside-diphosphate-sugar epimerase
MAIHKVLITGGFGYVGSRLTPLLLEKGYFVRVIDLNLYGNYGLDAVRNSPHFSKWKDRFEWIQEDIRHPKSVEKAVDGMDAVIHLAAISNDPTGEVDEVLTRQVNFDAIGLLVHFAKKHSVQRFINASSSSVFGARKEANIDETLEPEPLTYYSKYKMLAEWIVLGASTPNFCTVNIRPATICGYSPRQRLDLTVNKLTADGIQKKVITVHGGTQRRPNVGMTDMVNLYEQLLRIDSKLINGQTFNFGFENLKVLEIAQLIRENLGNEQVELKVTDTQDLRDYHISSEKILASLGYQPVSSITQEVVHLQREFAKGHCADVEHPDYYNMKSMKLGRHPGAYEFLSGLE